MLFLQWLPPNQLTLIKLNKKQRLFSPKIINKNKIPAQYVFITNMNGQDTIKPCSKCLFECGADDKVGKLYGKEFLSSFFLSFFLRIAEDTWNSG